VEGWLIFLLAKLIDWPTVTIGTCAGLLAASWLRVLPVAVLASLIAELVITQVRGWTFSPALFALGVVAAVPWVALGFGLRAVVKRWVSPPRTGG
jgi:hypothetical protein